MPTPRCFENERIQFLHKYLDLLLALILGIMGWWLIDINNRITKINETTASLSTTLQGERMRQEEILRHLDKIDTTIQNLDSRFYQFFREFQK